MPVPKHAPLRKLILVPCLISQFFFEVPLVFVFGIRAFLASSRLTGGNTAALVFVDLPLLLSVCACLALTILETVWLLRMNLTPFAFVMNTVKSILWTGVFGFQTSGMFTAPRPPAVLSVFYVVVSFACFWIPLGYGSVVAHKARKDRISYKAIDPAAVPLASLELDAEYSDYNPTTKKTLSNGDLESDGDLWSAVSGRVGGYTHKTEPLRRVQDHDADRWSD